MRGQFLFSEELRPGVMAALQELKLEFPDVDPAKRRELAAARTALEQEGNKTGKRKRKLLLKMSPVEEYCVSPLTNIRDENP